MSTEDQLAERLSRRLRAEVAVLEQPADLLTVLHSRQARRARARRAGLAAAPLAIMGVAAAVVVLGTGAGGAPGHPAPAGSSGSVPRQGALRTAILTAFHGAQSYVLYDSRTTTISGQAVASGSWYWPAQPSAGQRATARYLTLGGDGKPLQDASFSYSVPPGGAGKVTGRTIDVEYANRTWSDQRGVTFPVKGSGSESAATIRSQVAAGHWTVVGPRTLGGRETIELNLNSAPDDPGTASYLWVDAHTYLPVKAVFSYLAGKPGSMHRGTIVDEFSYLPPTSANLAKLQVTVPQGFIRTATQELPQSPGGGKG